MISSVSSVNFGDTAPVQNYNDLINSPGKYVSSPAPEAQAVRGDEVDLSTKPEKKSHTGAIIGGVIGALALAWIGLGIAVGRKGSTWQKIETPEGFTQKAKNFFYAIGDSAKKSYDATLGKWFSKGEKDAAKATSETPAAGGTAPAAPEAPAS